MPSLRPLLPAALALLVACTEPASGVKGEVLEYGMCKQEPDARRYSQPDSLAGYATQGDLKLTPSEGPIPLVKGSGFGLRWQATGVPAQAEFQFKVQHPVIKRPDGKYMDGFEETLRLRADRGRVVSVDCYAFTEDHEMVAGNWTISVLYNGKVLASKMFRVAAGEA